MRVELSKEEYARIQQDRIESLDRLKEMKERMGTPHGMFVRLPNHERIKARGIYFQESAQPVNPLVAEWIAMQDGLLLAGERVALGDLQSLFGVPVKTVLTRMFRNGLSPEDAVFSSQSAIRSMSREEQLFSGWKFWCERFGLPTHEQGLMLVGDFGQWIPDDRWVPAELICEVDGRYEVSIHHLGENPYVKGREYLAGNLAEHQGDPQALMAIWLQAVSLDGNVEIREKGSGDWRSRVIIKPILSIHHRCRGCLPESMWWGEDSFREIRKWVSDYREGPDSYDVLDTFGFLGLCALIRWKVRQRWQLVIREVWNHDSIKGEQQKLLRRVSVVESTACAYRRAEAVRPLSSETSLPEP